MDLSNIVFLILGTVAGAVASCLVTIAAHRPRLGVGGTLTSSLRGKETCVVLIRNQPKFMGTLVDGGTAKGVCAHLRSHGDTLRSSKPLFWWSGDSHLPRIDIDPAATGNLPLFQVKSDQQGYCVVDHKGDPVAQFDDKFRRFVLTLHDFLGRETVIKFAVRYSDSTIQGGNRLQTEFLSMRPGRWQHLKSAFAKVIERRKRKKAAHPD